LVLSPFKRKSGAGAHAITSGDANSAGIIERFRILQPQEVILGLLGEYIGPDERAWSGGLVQILGDLGYSNAASRVALNRVIARGLLAPEKEGRFVFYTITPRLRVVHSEGRNRVFSEEIDPEWTGRWTIVFYGVSDEERVHRAQLGRWLRLRGFGQLQEGVWIAPGEQDADVLALARRLKLEKQVTAFLGELGKSHDVRQTISRAWKVEELKALYQMFVDDFRPQARQLAKLKKQPRAAFVVRTRLIEMFRQTTMYDPRIPDRMLGLNWRRGEAIELFQTLHKALLPTAAAYFRSHAVTGELIGEDLD
jgi:phenylacetic acid degradation operon negative regulatory protein